jgi:serine/threonine protein kinase
VGTLNNVLEGRPDGALTGLVITSIFVLLWRRAANRKPTQGQKHQPAMKQSANGIASRAEHQAAPKPKSLSAEERLVDTVAERLRALATRYEDLSQSDVLVQQNLYIDRITKATSVQGPCVFVIRRHGFHIEFMNQNTRTGKVNKIDRTWRQIKGCLPHEYSLYFNDDTMVTFYPTNKEEQLFFDIAWQVFADSMNGEEYLFMDTKASGIGPFLRDIARHIQDNRQEVSKSNRFDVEQVKRTVEPELLPTEDVLLSPPQAGEKIGPYKLAEQLGGESGFGMVFRAVDSRNQGEVSAMKVMRLQSGVKPKTPEFYSDAEDFMREAKLSSNYMHIPFLVTALDYSMEPWPYIRYPLVEGKTVSSLVESGYRFEGDRWWELAHDILFGLSEIHDDGMVHRDIKWDNVMVTEQCAKILDFGLSQVSDYLGDKVSTAHARPFAAPEIISIRSAADVASLTPKADVYGAGLVLYMARVGQKLPYVISRDWNAVQTLEARKLARIEREFFNELEFELLSKMLAFDAETRISTRDALQIVAPHLNLEPKIVLLEEALLKTYKHKASEEVSAEETTEQEAVSGPFESWRPIEEFLRSVMEVKRPRYFSLDLNFIEEREFVYVQGYFDGGGWSIECMSEKFSDMSHSKDMKRTFMNLGWNPPTSDSPNYQRESLGTDATKSIAWFVDAFEQGYKIKPHMLASVEVSMQGPGHF